MLTQFTSDAEHARATTEVLRGRDIAALGREIVVFLIGARFNRLLEPRRRVPNVRAVPPVPSELLRDPSLGLFGAHSFWSSRVSRPETIQQDRGG